MPKMLSRLKNLFSSPRPRTARELSEAFTIIAKSTPRKIGEGAFSFRRDGFLLRFLASKNDIRIYGSAPDSEEVLWFAGHPSDLPNSIQRKIRPLLPKGQGPSATSTIFSDSTKEPATSSAFRMLPHGVV